jgi:hypothetical protein
MPYKIKAKYFFIFYFFFLKKQHNRFIRDGTRMQIPMEVLKKREKEKRKKEKEKKR